MPDITYKHFEGKEPFRYRSGFLVNSDMHKMVPIIQNCAWSPLVWRDGVAKTDNFLYADFLVLDFDAPGDMTMAQVDNVLSDHQRIIATTKSHMKDKGGVTCERYRLIIPFSRRITDIAEYKYNYKLALKRFDWADHSTGDGARFFFPSTGIYVQDFDSEYTWDVVEVPQGNEVIAYQQGPITGKAPSWCLAFINDGRIYNNSRSLTCFYVATELFRQGFGEQKIRIAIKRAPICWKDVSFEAILKSSMEKVYGKRNYRISEKIATK